MSSTRSRPDPPSTLTVFETLGELCTSPGYVHTLCSIAFANNFVNVTSGATAEQWTNYHRPDRLTRREQDMLAGLLLKRPIDYTVPTMETMTRHIARTHELLQMLHHSFFSFDMHQRHVGQEMTEPIFYSAESAQPFQYGDFAVLRYQDDEQWLRKHRGFSIDDALVVAQAIQHHQQEAVSEVVSVLCSNDTAPDTSMFHRALAFSFEDIATAVDIDNNALRAILRSFSAATDERNAGFASPGHFNIVRAQPIIRQDDGMFVLFDNIGLMESLYVSPYYWMVNTSYQQVASEHRGRFSEQIVYRRLQHVFGEKHVFRNVELTT